MSSQRYQRVSTTDESDHVSSLPAQPGIPSSPPPSFRSAASSPISRQFPLASDPLASDADRALADSFDNEEDSDGEGESDDRQRLMRSQTSESVAANPRDGIQRRMTQLPQFSPAASGTRGRPSPNDGVFANLDAKPEVGEKVEEQPPSYEQAAADATPPYWESTVMVPGGVGSDDIYIDGLPVGSVFAFLWNGMISMSFQVVGFLLTYLLHTTHAAKNGSRAGLGITMIQYGFYMKGTSRSSDESNAANTTPPDPNAHDFSTAAVDASLVDTSSSVSGNDMLAYALMVVGWFILIRSVSDFLRARHMKAVVMQTPDRGLGVAVVGEGEAAETAV